MASYFRQAREWATPTLKESAFLDRGVLTPEEFVKAGDELVYRCPTWQWSSSTRPSKSYLPEDKQFLITRNVPCPTRCRQLEGSAALNFETADNDEGFDDDGEAWLVSSKALGNKADDDNDIEDDFDILDEDGEVVAPPAKPSAVDPPAASETSAGAAAGAGGDDDDEYADMMDDDDDAMVDDNILQDDDMAVTAATGTANDGDGGGDNVLKVRTYDLSITYDKYYQTPRIFLIGRNTNDQPLTGEEMMQDVMSDYANKTVTMESHPHVSGPHASIHPCQHGKVMKVIVQNLIKNASETSKPPSVEMYLFIFLKFVSSMIPTIQYDFTMDVQADTSK